MSPTPIALRLHPCLLGLFAITSYRTLLSLHGASDAYGGALPLNSQLARFGLEVAICLTVALLAGRITPLRRHRWLMAGATLVCVAAALLRTVALTPWVSQPLFWAAGALGTGASALLVLAWLELYATMDLRHVLTYYTLVHALSAGLSFGVDAITGGAGNVLITMALPLLSLAGLGRADRFLADASFAQGERTLAPGIFPVRPVALMVTFTLANVFVRGTLPHEESAFAMVGVVAAATLVFTVLSIRGVGRFDVWSLGSGAFLLTLAGLLGSLLSHSLWWVAAAVCTNAGYALFSIFLTVALCNLSFRYGASALALFGFSNAAGYVASFVGYALNSAPELHDGDPLVLTVSCLALLLACCFAVFVRSQAHGPLWGFGLAGEEAHDEVVDGPEQICAVLAREYGLTRREEEVLALLAQDKTAAQIEEALCVSNPTVKSHTRLVYRKLGVHSRAELVALVEAAATKPPRPSKGPR